MKRFICIAAFLAFLLCACNETAIGDYLNESTISQPTDKSGYTESSQAESSQDESSQDESSQDESSQDESSQTKSEAFEETSEALNAFSTPEESYITPESIKAQPILFWDTEDEAFGGPIFIGGVSERGFYPPEEFIYNGKHLYSLCDIYGEAVDTNAVEADILLEFYDTFGSKTEAKSGECRLYHEDALPLYLLTNEITVVNTPQSRFLIGSVGKEGLFAFPDKNENGEITLDINRDGENERIYTETKKEQDHIYSLKILLESSGRTISVEELQYAAISSEKSFCEFFFADIDFDNQFEIIVYYSFNDERESFVTVYDFNETELAELYTQTIHYLN